jgi:hypothetical protein
MIVKDTSLAPPGGWRYTQPETGFEFTASTLREVVRKVTAHREANGIAVGDPSADIQDFVCAQLPIGSEDCTHVIEGDYALKTHFTMEDVKRFVQAAVAALGSRGLVEQTEAERRAAICASCPLNTTIKGCWRCKGMAEWLFRLIGARRTAHGSRLNQCGVCGCAIKAKIWLPQDVAQQVSEGYTFPSWCWLNDTSSRGN